MIRKVLIACRGEAANRLIAEFAKSNVRTVAVYTEEDHSAEHVQLADEIICIGETLKSYVTDWARIILAGEISDVDAIHAGGGPLSDHKEFAKGCAESGIRLMTDSEQGGFT
jgi:acetyl/propionyl-CoA carboxylase alpha subunit